MSKARTTLVSVGFFVVVGAAFFILYTSNRLVKEHTRQRLAVAINSLAVASAPVFIVADPAVGALRKSDLEYNEIPFPAGRLALDALKGGNVEIATAAETPVVLASVDRPDLRIVATIAKSKLRVIARRSAGIASVGDLKGRRVADLGGSSSEYLLGRVLASAGLPVANMKVVNLQPPDMVAALIRHDVDAISIWEPFAQRAMDAMGADALAFDQQTDGLYTEYFNIVTTAGVLRDRQKRAAISTFLSSLARANDTLYKDPISAKKLVAARLSMDPRELDSIWSRFTFGTDLDVEALLRTMLEVEAWNAVTGKRSARTATDLRRLVDDSLVAGR